MLDYVESLSGGKLLRPSFGRICVLEMLSAKSEKKPLRWFRRCQITQPICSISLISHKIFSLSLRKRVFSYWPRPTAHHTWNTS